MKNLKATLALGLVAAFFAGCAKSDNTNSTTTNTTTSNTSSTATSPAATPPPASATGNSAHTGHSSPSSPSSPSSSSGAGEVFRHGGAGVQFTLPAGWKTKTEGETITATSQHEAISVVLWVPESDDFEQATEALREQLRQVVKNPQVTSPGKEITHNGMRAYTAAGTGEVNGQTVLWEVDIVQAKKPFFVVTFASPDMFRMHQSDYQQLLASLKPMQ